MDQGGKNESQLGRRQPLDRHSCLLHLGPQDATASSPSGLCNGGISGRLSRQGPGRGWPLVSTVVLWKEHIRLGEILGFQGMPTWARAPSSKCQEAHSSWMEPLLWENEEDSPVKPKPTPKAASQWSCLCHSALFTRVRNCSPPDSPTGENG